MTDESSVGPQKGPVTERVYCTNDYPHQILTGMLELLQMERLCDATLRIGNQQLKAHRLVLMAASPHLLTMCENVQGQSTLEMKLPTDISFTTLKAFLRYLYLGKITVSRTNMHDLFKIAKLFQIDTIIEFCQEFAKEAELDLMNIKVGGGKERVEIIESWGDTSGTEVGDNADSEFTGRTIRQAALKAKKYIYSKSGRRVQVMEVTETSEASPATLSTSDLSKKTAVTNSVGVTAKTDKSKTVKIDKSGIVKQKLDPLNVGSRKTPPEVMTDRVTRVRTRSCPKVIDLDTPRPQRKRRCSNQYSSVSASVSGSALKEPTPQKAVKANSDKESRKTLETSSSMGAKNRKRGRPRKLKVKANVENVSKEFPADNHSETLAPVSPAIIASAAIPPGMSVKNQEEDVIEESAQYEEMSTSIRSDNEEWDQNSHLIKTALKKHLKPNKSKGRIKKAKNDKSRRKLLRQQHRPSSVKNLELIAAALGLAEEERQYKCLLCGNEFVFPKRCLTHLVKTHNINEDEIIEHVHVEKREKALKQCDICGYTTKDPNFCYIHYHKYFRHRIPLPRGWEPFTCDICGKECFTKFQLRDHKMAHEEKTPFICDVCGTGFKSRTCLNSHVFHRHNNARKHPCTECKKPFKTKTQMLVHMRTHTGEKPFHCPECPYKSTTRGNMRLHLNNRHKLDQETIKNMMYEIKTLSQAFAMHQVEDVAAAYADAVSLATSQTRTSVGNVQDVDNLVLAEPDKNNDEEVAQPSYAIDALLKLEGTPAETYIVHSSLPEQEFSTDMASRDTASPVNIPSPNTLGNSLAIMSPEEPVIADKPQGGSAVYMYDISQIPPRIASSDMRVVIHHTGSTQPSPVELAYGGQSLLTHPQLVHDSPHLQGCHASLQLESDSSVNQPVRVQIISVPSEAPPVSPVHSSQSALYESQVMSPVSSSSAVQSIMPVQFVSHMTQLATTQKTLENVHTAASPHLVMQHRSAHSPLLSHSVPSSLTPQLLSHLSESRQSPVHIETSASKSDPLASGMASESVSHLSSPQSPAYSATSYPQSGSPQQLACPTTPGNQPSYEGLTPHAIYDPVQYQQYYQQHYYPPSAGNY